MTTKLTGYPSIDRVHLAGIDEEMLNPQIISLNLLSMFLAINAHDMGAIAISRKGRNYTRAELNVDSVALAKGLRLIGLKEQELITIATPNLIEGIDMSFAANAIGIRFNYANHLGTDEQLLEHLSGELNNYESAAVLVYHKNDEFVDKLFERTPKLRRVINVSPANPKYGIGHEVISEVRHISYESLLRTALASDLDISDLLDKYRYYDGVSFYLQTSGSSSGRPKGLMFTNRAVYAALIYAKNSTGTNTHDKNISKVLCILPYRLPYGWMTIFVNLIGGNRIELADGAEPEDIGKYYLLRPSYIYGTPLIFRNFMDNTPEDEDLSFLVAIFASGFAISEEWYQEGMKYLRSHNSHGEIRNNYGIGEALCIGTASDGVPHRANTSGKFYVGPKWVIVDENGDEVKYDQPGELIVKSESLFKGYFKEPEMTAEAFTSFKGEKGYFKTGDFVSLSKDGYVTFLGRKKRFYQPLGATDKVNCETIERALLKEIDLVETCAVVICNPDGRHETSKAFVVLQEHTAPSDSTKKKLYVRIYKTLLDYQLPSDIVFVKRLPVMSSGKIDYMKLKSMC